MGDNQSLISIHAYVVENCRKVLLLLNLQWVTKGRGFNNFFIMLIQYSPTTLEDWLIGIWLTLVCFSVDGVTVFHGLKTWYTIQLVEKIPHLSLKSIACHIITIWQCKFSSTYHWLETLSNYCSPYLSTFLIPLIGTWEVGKIFANKRFEIFSEFQNLVDLHALAKHVLIEYKNLVDAWWPCWECNCKSNNYELLCDYETIMVLSCVLPMLEAMQGLLKLAQGRDTFV